MSVEGPRDIPVAVDFADTDAGFEEFVEEFAPRLKRVAVLLCGDDVAAEDLTQTALLKTYRRWSRAVAGSPFAYARAALVNSHRDGLRRLLVRRRDAHLVAQQERVSDSASRIAERQTLLAALATLPPRQRLVVVLRYWEDMSEEDVARTAGISVGTVKSTASRALARLRAELGENDA